jgi:hypothetical protein
MCGRFNGPCYVVDCGTMKKPRGRAMGKQLEWWAEACRLREKGSHVDGHLAVESQWLGDIQKEVKKGEKNGRVIAARISSTLGVAANRGGWVDLAEYMGWSTYVLHPSTWRAVIGRSPKLGNKRKQVKARAIDAVMSRKDQLFRYTDIPKKMPDHTAEAILIGEYQAKELQQENLRSGRK